MTRPTIHTRAARCRDGQAFCTMAVPPEQNCPQSSSAQAGPRSDAGARPPFLSPYMRAMVRGSDTRAPRPGCRRPGGRARRGGRRRLRGRRTPSEPRRPERIGGARRSAAQRSPRPLHRRGGRRHPHPLADLAAGPGARGRPLPLRADVPLPAPDPCRRRPPDLSHGDAYVLPAADGLPHLQHPDGARAGHRGHGVEGVLDRRHPLAGPGPARGSGCTGRCARSTQPASPTPERHARPPRDGASLCSTSAASGSPSWATRRSPTGSPRRTRGRWPGPACPGSWPTPVAPAASALGPCWSTSTGVTRTSRRPRPSSSSGWPTP